MQRHQPSLLRALRLPTAPPRVVVPVSWEEKKQPVDEDLEEEDGAAEDEVDEAEEEEDELAEDDEVPAPSPLLEEARDRRHHNSGR